MTCFIACAFGYDDVDNTYNIIKRVLSSLGITPQRVDRIDHNKKIDQKIIELIGKCDFGIADLTYARPSVYYEAGRIHGLGKEVIFTCRSDHFKPNPDDKIGNLKVHFDLVTENILAWGGHKSSLFEKNLQRRVKKVIVPILKNEQVKKELVQEENDFQKCSLVQRRDMVGIQTTQFIHDLIGYRLVDQDRQKANVLAIKGKKTIKVILGYVQITFGASELLTVYRYWNPRAIQELQENRLKVKEVMILICALKNVSEATLQKLLPHFSKPFDNLKVYASNHKEDYKVTIAVVDNIKSKSDLNKRLAETFIAYF